MAATRHQPESSYGAWRPAYPLTNKERSEDFIEKLFRSVMGIFTTQVLTLPQGARASVCCAVQGQDPRGGLHRDAIGGQLNGLGETP